MRKICLIILTFFLLFNISVSQNNGSVKLSWVKDNSIDQQVGASWGIPWPQGKIQKDQQFALTNSKGEKIPVQSWVMAYWPDGSIKWTGHSSVVNRSTENFRITPLENGSRVQEENRVEVNENKNDYIVETGAVNCVIPKKGKNIIEEIEIDGRVVAETGKLISILQAGPEDAISSSPNKEKLIGRIEKVTVEQEGPVRSVIQIEGVHTDETRDIELFPFEVRLYFYAGSKNIRMVHNFIYDGDKKEDFIDGIGIKFSVPFREELHNRHVRFSGQEEGLWAEPVKPLFGRRKIEYKDRNIYKEQVAGKRVPDKEEYNQKGQYLISEWPAWDAYRLYQNSADGFMIKKRTNPNSTWIDAGAGTRSSGLGFVGDVSGGLAIGLKNFWESYPSTIEIENARDESADLKMWFWSPKHSAMDLRHYDTTAHSLEASYEDVQEGLSTPKGIARTNELMLAPTGQVPSDSRIVQKAHIGSQTPQLVCKPQYYHNVNVFGEWSLPDRSTPVKRWLENKLTTGLEFYKDQIEQRNWYGFWDYGDVMHSYDPVRHSWKYDMGGFAWANTELMPNVWLWYSFLRTGNEDYFKMAEAMTRHCSEVDVYHKGKLKGLGSRHNVVHWGCGSKEVRISQSYPKRFYHYITTDERTGDLMKQQRRVDTTMTKWDPLRKYAPEIDYPTHIRFGPDWLALVGNWMTAWERTGDEKWKKKILRGVDSFAKMPYGFFSGEGATFGYDPENNKVYNLGKEKIGYSHLSVLMGGPEVAFELSKLLDNEEWNELWLQFSTLFTASEEKVQEAFGRKADIGQKGAWYARLPAYASVIKDDSTLAKKAWKMFFNSGATQSIFEKQRIKQPDVLQDIDEIPNVSTNTTAQWSLNAIELLEMIDEDLPKELPESIKSKEK